MAMCMEIFIMNFSNYSTIGHMRNFRMESGVSEKKGLTIPATANPISSIPAKG